VNWLGNIAARGIRESFGIMVNYLYDPDRIEANHEAFVHEGAVARSAAVDALMTAPPTGRSVRASRNRRG
jgi:malonyl-CoA decarboxylase